MKIHIGIETKDRRLFGGENYIFQTIRNLRETGVFDSPYLGTLTVVSGGEHDLNFMAEIHSAIGPYGIAHPAWVTGVTRQQNAMRTIQAAAAVGQSDDWVMKLEDDLDFCGDFLGSTARWLEDHGDVVGVPMWSLGASFEQVSKSRFEPGETIWQPGPSFPNVRALLAQGKRALGHSVMGYWGAQALLWRQPVAASLARWLGPDPFLFDGNQKHRNRGHDLLLQVWGQSVGAKGFCVAIPSFVQHIGQQSNLSQPEIGHVQPFFQFPWAGRDWSYQRGERVAA